VVVITGASQGIGAEIAYEFAREVRGVRLALVARSETKLRAVAARCNRLGAVAEVFVANVADADAVKALESAVIARFRRVDVVVSNAGVFRPGSVLDTSVEAFDEMVAVNLRSQFLVTRAFVPAMAQRRSGDVFVMSSIAGLSPYPSSAAYCAAKFGVTGWAQVMRAELKAHGVRVCLVYPGATVSPSWDGSGVSPERMMPTRDVARAFLDVYRLSRKTVVEEIVLRPVAGDV